MTQDYEKIQQNGAVLKKEVQITLKNLVMAFA